MSPDDGLSAGERGSDDPATSALTAPAGTTLRIDVDPEGFGDWHGLHRLLRNAFAYMDARIDPPSSMHRLDVEGLAAKAREERLLIAREAGELVGCAFLRPGSPTMYLGKLAVRGDRCGGGVGTALVRRALALAAGEGARGVELQVRVELVENRAFFERLGFAKVGESAHAGHARPTSITMRADVHAPGAPASGSRRSGSSR